MKINYLIFLSLILFFSSCEKKESSNKNNNDETTTFIKVPQARQGYNYTCGVAALQSLLYYYGDEWRQDKLAQALSSDSVSGTNYRKIIQFTHNLGYSTKVLQNLSVDSLKLLTRQGFPLILVIQAWADDPSNYINDWEDGHYVLCIGYDKDKFYFMDPSTLGHFTYIPKDEFLNRWHDIDQEGIVLRNFALLISKGKSVYDPDEITRLE